MKTKFIFVSLDVKNGGFEYGAQSVHEVSARRTANRVGEDCAKNFYSERPFKFSLTDEWFHFFGGEISVRVRNAEEITQAEYEVLKKFQDK